MEPSISYQLRKVLTTDNGKREVLLKKREVLMGGEVDEDFFDEVRLQFHLGIHTSYLASIVKVMKEKCGTNQDIADMLGLASGTSVAHMFSSGFIDGLRMTTAFFYYFEEISRRLPSRQASIMYGLARATSYVKEPLIKGKAFKPELKPIEFSYLVNILAISEEWENAIKDVTSKRINEIAKRIVTDKNVLNLDPVFEPGCRDDDYVRKLQKLYDTWANSAAIALWAVSSCEPIDISE